LYITDFGKEIATAAEKILNEVHAINFKIHAFNGKLSGRLKISIVSTGKYIMPYFLTGFMKANPDVELQMDVTNKQKVINSLENNEVDFSLVSVLPEKLQIEKIELVQNKLYLVGNKETAFPNAIYDKTIFDSVPLIYRELGSGTRQTMEKFIEKNKITARKKMELTTNEAVKQAVIAGLGYSIMPIIGIKDELKNNQLQIIPVKNFPINSHWHLIWLKGKKLSPIAEAYLNYIKKEKSIVIAKYFA
jgi:DNA-binding transcriptional LysR family regulator